MSNYRHHTCPKPKYHDGDDTPPEPALTMCGANGSHNWCERCDPGPSALCPFCDHGSSTAPIPPRQVRALTGGF